MLNIGVRRRNGGVWEHMGAYGCVMDAYECIRMHTDASGCILLGCAGVLITSRHLIITHL